MHEHFKVPIELFILGIIAYLIKYGSNVFLSNSLSTLMYGDLSVAIKLLSVASLLILIGTNSTAVKYFSVYHQEDNVEKMSQYLNWNFKFLKRSLAVTFAILCTITGAICYLHSLGMHPLADHHLSIYALWIAPVVAINILLSSYLLSAKEYVLPSFFIYLAPNLLIFTFFALGLFFFEIVYTTVHLTILLFFVFITLVVIQSLYFFNKLPFVSQALFKTQTSVHHEQKSWHSFSIKHYFVNSILLLVASADLVIIEFVGHNEHLVGHYAACLVIVSVLTTAASMTSKYIKPKINHFIQKHDDDMFKRMLYRFELTNCTVLLLLALLIITFRGPLLNNFGAEFSDAELPLVILTIGYFFAAVSKEPTSLLSYSGHADTLLQTSMAELISLIVLCTVFTHYWGLVGAATATTLVLFAKCLYVFWASRVERLYDHSVASL